jgi:hypothetical protein
MSDRASSRSTRGYLNLRPVTCRPPPMGDESRILPYGTEKRAAEVRGELHDVHLTPRLFSYSVSDSSLTPRFLIWIHNLSSEKFVGGNVLMFSVYQISLGHSCPCFRHLHILRASAFHEFSVVPCSLPINSILDP